MTVTILRNGKISKREFRGFSRLPVGTEWALVGGYAWGMTQEAREAAIAYAGSVDGNEG